MWLLLLWTNGKQRKQKPRLLVVRNLVALSSKASEDRWIDVRQDRLSSFSTIPCFGVVFFPPCFLGIRDFFAGLSDSYGSMFFLVSNQENSALSLPETLPLYWDFSNDCLNEHLHSKSTSLCQQYAGFWLQVAAGLLQSFVLYIFLSTNFWFYELCCFLSS